MRWMILLACVFYGLSLVGVGCLRGGPDPLDSLDSVYAVEAPAGAGGVSPAPFTADSGSEGDPALMREGATGAFDSEAASRDRPWVGFNFNVYHPEDLGAYLEGLDRVAEMGFGSVQIVTPMFQRDGGSPTVWLSQETGFGPTREQLVTLVRYAKGKGLRVSLMPQVNFVRPRGNEWRGKIMPPNWREWWASYEAAMDRFIDIANEGGADQLVVGCELISTQGAEHLERWRSLIEHIRGRYSGLLTYSTTWDSYHRILFWDRLDRVGVSGYWDMTRGSADPAHPTDAELAARWSGILGELEGFAKLTGRPVLVTELGYPSLSWALQKPWNYVPSGGAGRDVEAQRRAYEAAAAAWRGPLREATRSGDDAWLAGVMLYKWDIYGWGGPEDTGYGVRGKPAMGVVEGMGEVTR